MEYTQSIIEQLEHRNSRPTGTKSFRPWDNAVKDTRGKWEAVSDQVRIVHTVYDNTNMTYGQYLHFRIYDESYDIVKGNVNMNRLKRVETTEGEFMYARITTADFLYDLEAMYKVPRHFLEMPYDDFMDHYVKALEELNSGKMTGEGMQYSHHTFNVQYVIDELVPVWDKEVLVEGIDGFTHKRDWMVVGGRRHPVGYVIEMFGDEYQFQRKLNADRRTHNKVRLLDAAKDKMMRLLPISVNSLGINEGYYRHMEKELALIESYNAIMFGLNSNMRADAYRRMESYLDFINESDDMPSINKIQKACGGMKTLIKKAIEVFSKTQNDLDGYGFIERINDLLDEAWIVDVDGEPLDINFENLSSDIYGGELAAGNTILAAKPRKTYDPLWEVETNDSKAQQKLHDTVGQEISMRDYFNLVCTVKYYNETQEEFEKFVNDNMKRYTRELKADYYKHTLGWACDFEAAMEMFERHIEQHQDEEKVVEETTEELVKRVREAMNLRLGIDV